MRDTQSCKSLKIDAWHPTGVDKLKEKAFKEYARYTENADVMSYLGVKHFQDFTVNGNKYSLHQQNKRWLV